MCENYRIWIKKSTELSPWVSSINIGSDIGTWQAGRKLSQALIAQFMDTHVNHQFQVVGGKVD